MGLRGVAELKLCLLALIVPELYLGEAEYDEVECGWKCTFCPKVRE